MRRVERASLAHGSDAQEGAEFVNEIIIRYREMGLLDDLVYAKAQTQSLRRRGNSLRIIRARLQAKGVAREDIELAFAELDLSVTDADLSAAVIIARRRDWDRGASQTGPAAVCATLQRLRAEGFPTQSLSR